MGRTTTAAVTSCATLQHGAVGAGAARSIGVTRRWVDNLARRGVAAGRARRVRRRPARRRRGSSARPSACSPSGERPGSSHEAAAALHGLDRAPLERRRVHGRAASAGEPPDAVHGAHDDVAPADRRVVVERLPLRSRRRGRSSTWRARACHAARLEAAIDSAVRHRPVGAARARRRGSIDLRGPGRWGAPARSTSCSSTPAGTRCSSAASSSSSDRPACRGPATQVVHRARRQRRSPASTSCSSRSASSSRSSGRLGHSSPAERARDAQRRNELQDVGRAGLRVHVGGRHPATRPTSSRR